MKTISQAVAAGLGAFLFGTGGGILSAQPVILTQITIPSYVGNVAVNPSLNLIYLSGGASTAQQIVIVNGNTFASVGAGTGMGVDVDLTNNNYWSGGVYSDSVTAWSSAGASLATEPTGAGCSFETSVDAPHRRVWVGAQCSDSIWVFNADTGASETGPISPGGTMGGLRVNPVTGRAYFNSSGAKRVNPSTFAVTISAFGPVLGFNVASDLIYAYGSSSSLQIINGAPDPEVLLTNVTLPFQIPATPIGVNPALNRIYVGMNGVNTVMVLNAVTGQTIGSVTLSTGTGGVNGMAVDATRNRVYVIASVNGVNTLYVLQDNAAPAVSLVCGNDPLLIDPAYLASDGVNLFVVGAGTGTNQDIFKVPVTGGAATHLYNAYNPDQITLQGTSLFWIDPNAGPIGDTEILQAPTNGSGSVTPIYIGSDVNQPIVDGSGLASDGSVLYAADYVDGTVWRLNPDGSGLTQLGPDRYTGYFSTEHRNTIAASQGVLYIADSGRSGVDNPQVVSIPTNGSSFTTLFSGAPFVSPDGIAVGNGMVYVADAGATNTIWQIPTNGGAPSVLVSGAPFQQVQGLAFVNGTLYVCDSVGGAIYAVNPNTTTTQFALNVSTAGGGSFTVSPPGPYTSNTVVTLTATASNNWSFIGWTGSVVTNAASFQITMNSNQTEQAVFGTTLNVQQLAGGTVQVSPTGSLYAYGSTVVLTAVPQGANFFQTWLDAASPGGNVNPYNFTVTSPTPTIAAQFAAAPGVTLVCGNDPNLLYPFSLAGDGFRLYVSGQGVGNAQDIFTVPIGGGGASILFDALNPQQVALAGTSVYWIDPNAGPIGDTEILQAQTNGSGSEAAIYIASQVGQPIVDGSGIASDGTFLYAADEVDGTVWRLNLNGSGLTQLGPSRYSGYFSTEHYNSVAVSQGVLYLADSGRSGTISPQVISIPSSGGAFSTLALGAPFVNPLGVAAANGIVYVSDPGANNTIWKMPISGGTPVPLISGAPFNRIQGLAFVNGTLYVCDPGAGAIFAVSLSTSPGFSLNISTAGGGSLLVSPSGPYTNGTVVTLTATPSNNWSFIGWTGSVATNASSFTLVMNSNQTEQAVFGTALTVQQNPGGTVQVSPIQSLYPFGSTVTLSAIPQSTNFFQNWLDSASAGGDASPYVFTVTTAKPTVAAQFSPNPTISIVTNFNTPGGLALSAVNGALNKIYFASGNPAAEQMVVMDGSTFAQTPVGTGDAVGVDVVNNNYWSAGVYSGSATVWNGANNASTQVVPLADCPIDVSVDSVNRVVWIGAQCGGGNDPVWAINADTFAIKAGPIGSGGVQGPIYVNPATGRLYLNAGGSKRVNPTNGYALTANAFGALIGVNVPENLLYAYGSGTSLQIINGAPDPEVVLANVPLPIQLGGNPIGVNPALNRLYVGDSSSDGVLILNATTGQTLGSVLLSPAVTSVGSILVDTNHSRIYVAASGGGSSYLYVLQDQLSVNPTYSLTASTAGGGSVMLSPASATYTNSAVVTLTAVPSNSWSFIGWTGNVSTNAASFTITMNSNTTVQAVFGTALTVSSSTGGSVQASPSQSLYPFGSTVLLTAVPSNSYYFTNWLDAASAGGTNSPYNFLVTNAAPTVAAQFAQIPNTMFSLSLQITGSGTVTSTPSALLYNNGATVSLSATPGPNQFFYDWTGAGGNSTNNPLAVVMNSNKTVIANFVTPAPPTIGLTAPAPGQGFAWPAPVPITASAATSYGTVTNVVFLIDGVSNGAAAVAPFNFTWNSTMVGNHTLTAIAAASTGLSATSAPVTVFLTNAIGTLSFSSSNYFVHESNGAVTLAVVSTLGGASNAVAGYDTADGTAHGGGPLGNGSGGDYTAASGILSFNGAGSRTFPIPIVDNFSIGAPITFQVSLIPAGSPPAALGNPAVATVTILLDDTNNGSLTQRFPDPQPPTTGQLTVFLAPSQSGGQWRFPWEFAWRTNGQTASNLMAGDYPVVFANEPGYLAIPLAADPQVTNGVTTVAGNTYFSTAQPLLGALGSLTVFTYNAGSTPTGWQFFGETAWRAAGSTAANLLPDTYQIAFQPVAGYITPPSLAVAVTNMDRMLIGSNYNAATPVAGAAMPAPLANSAVTNYPTPDAFCGQLQTDVGFGSGVAVSQNVVLTAAHLVFNDYTLSQVSNAFWSFQESAGTYAPEPQAARGVYLLSGYAAQRATDLADGIGYDQSSPASRDLDAAALFFYTPVARNGYSGYLSSSGGVNPYLTSATVPKFLAGYPVDGSQFGSNVVPGQMYATAIGTSPFALANDEVYTNSTFFSYPGNSGGPVMIEAANTGSAVQYYPAAIYLGTLFNEGVPYASVVRAIDTNVTSLIASAAQSGSSGVNNSGGGAIQLYNIVPIGVSSTNPAYLIVQLGPAAAVQAGAAWKLTNQDTTYYSTLNPSLQEVTGTNTLALQFRQIPGWNTPSNRSLTLLGGQMLTNMANYTVTNPALSLSPALQLSISGTTNTRYAIESNSTLNAATWVSFLTNTLTNFNTNFLLSHPRPGFYRALWLTN